MCPFSKQKVAHCKKWFHDHGHCHTAKFPPRDGSNCLQTVHCATRPSNHFVTNNMEKITERWAVPPFGCIISHELGSAAQINETGQFKMVTDRFVVRSFAQRKVQSHAKARKKHSMTHRNSINACHFMM